MVFSYHDGRLMKLLQIVGNPPSDRVDFNMARYEILSTIPKYVIDSWAQYEYDDYRVNDALKFIQQDYYNV